jgi:S-methylmethionine-dependent homocysteine/selenocysteine methylase
MAMNNLCGPDWLQAKLDAGGLIIIDGAMGTELEARGVPMNNKAWSGAALLTHPTVVREAHVDYIRAGAEVIITNTFAAGRSLLDSAGLGAEVVKINRKSVEVARQAREEAAEQPVAIAGSMCEWAASGEHWSDTNRLYASYREQADILAEAGVELIALEMCSHPVRSRLIAEAAIATGLPVWLGLSCKQEAETGRVVGFDEPNADIDALVRDLVELDIALINVMHSPIGDTAAALSVVKRHWSGPIGTYPESGYFIMPNWQFVDIIEPADLVEETRTWITSGAQIIGGCCGLGVDHICALKAAFGEEN